MTKQHEDCIKLEFTDLLAEGRHLLGGRCLCVGPLWLFMWMGPLGFGGIQNVAWRRSTRVAARNT